MSLRCLTTARITFGFGCLFAVLVLIITNTGSITILYSIYYRSVIEDLKNQLP